MTRSIPDILAALALQSAGPNAMGVRAMLTEPDPPTAEDLARALDSLGRNSMIRLVVLSQLAKTGHGLAEEEFYALASLIGVEARVENEPGDAPLVDANARTEGELLSHFYEWVPTIKEYAEAEANWLRGKRRWPPRRYTLTLRLAHWVTSVRLAYTVEIASIGGIDPQPLRHLHVLVHEDGRILQAELRDPAIYSGFADFFRQFADAFFPLHAEIPFTVNALEPIRRETTGGDGTDRTSSWRTGIAMHAYVPLNATPDQVSAIATGGSLRTGRILRPRGGSWEQ